MGWTILDTSKLREIDLFQGLSESALEAIAAIIYTKEYRRGKKIFSDGEPGRAMYIIQSGEIRISKDTPVGEECLAVLTAGAYFGEMALLEAEPRSADAWAARQCTVSVIDKEDLMRVMDNDKALSSELLWSFVGTLCRRLREANNKVTFLTVAGSH
jgi:CRP/FNR family transcriptional regulator, cyclic AMP receptor protein